MAEPVLYASFIVRLWREPGVEAANEQEPAWNGEAESIQTGRVWQFEGVSALARLLVAQLPAVSTQTRETDGKESHS